MSKEIQKTTGNSWLAEAIEGDTSLDSLAEYRVLSRAAIVQSLSKEALKDAYGEGAIVLQPGNSLLSAKGKAFNFVPLFHFTEYILWADRKDPNQTIIERTFDPASQLAQNCRNPELWKVPYEDGSKMEYRNVEQIIFAGVPYNHEALALSVIAVGFDKGEFYQGKNFASACMQRSVLIPSQATDEDGEPMVDDDGEPVIVTRAKRIPLYSQVWELNSNLREKNGDKWFGIDFRSPTTCSAMVEDQEDFMGFQKLHLGLKADFEKNRLRSADTDESTGGDGSSDAAAAEGEKRGM